MRKIYFSSLLLVLILGCTPITNSVQDKSSFEEVIPLEENLTNMSTPIILIGDSQEHEDFGRPLLDGTRLIDNLVDVTRRTAQANLNAIEIMNSILKKHKDKPIVHLGDFLDISCHDEFNRAINVLAQHDKWIVMLGNHDGYYVGNFLKKEVSSDWAARCDSGRFYKKLKLRDINKSNNFENTLDDEIEQYNDENKTAHVRAYNKSTVIERYLSTLFRKNKEINQTIHSQYNKIFDSHHRFQDSNKSTETIKKMKNLTYTFVTSKKGKGNKKERIIEYTNEKNNVFIKKIYAYVNQNKYKSNLSSGNPQKSFLLQKVSLNKEIELILLDTSVYEKPYSNRIAQNPCNIKKFAGEVGNLTSKTNEFIQDNQLKIVEKWLKENDDNNITSIFAGHHPLSKVGELQHFFQNNLNYKPILYISAHTHQGFWRKHKKELKHVTELNIGSLIDFPIHYRTLQLKKEKKKDLEVFSELKEVEPLMVSQLTGQSCKAKWNRYLNYPYANPDWQENEYKYLINVWKSQHLILLPYLSYYLKLLETDEAQKHFTDFNISFQGVRTSSDTKCTMNKIELIKYLKKSIQNFEKKIINKESVIKNEGSCIKVIEGKLKTRDCSNLLYYLRRDENNMFKDTNMSKSFFSTYKVCTALNAIEIDARTSKVKLKYQDGDLNIKKYKECNSLYKCQKFEFGNRKIENLIIK